jgi:hypothetical protein
MTTTPENPPAQKRYFYTDPLAAAWTAKHFSMRLVTPHGEDLLWHDGKLMFRKPYPFEGGVLEGKWLLIESLDPHYIHSDSLYLLEPQDRDSGESDGNSGEFSKAKYSTDEFNENDLVFYQAGNELPYALDGNETVTRRNGMAFHWPEEEA